MFFDLRGILIFRHEASERSPVRPEQILDSAAIRPRPRRRTRARQRRRRKGRDLRPAPRGRRRGGAGRGRRRRGRPGANTTTADICAGGAGRPRRSGHARVAGRGRDVNGVKDDEAVMLRDAGGGAAARNEAGAAAVGPPRPTSAPAGHVVRDRPTTPATPNTPATQTTTERTRGGGCATRAEARRGRTRPPPPWQVAQWHLQ